MEKQISELLTIKKTLQKEQRDLLINKFLRNRLAVIGSIIVLFMIFLAIFADVISPQGPLDMIVKIGCRCQVQNISLVQILLGETYFQERFMVRVFPC